MKQVIVRKSWPRHERVRVSTSNIDAYPDAPDTTTATNQEEKPISPVQYSTQKKQTIQMNRNLNKVSEMSELFVKIKSS